MRRCAGQEERTPLSSAGLRSLEITTKSVRCRGCGNHCLLKVHRFSNGHRFVSGNRCERGGMGHSQDDVPVMPNIYAWKARRLFRYQRAGYLFVLPGFLYMLVFVGWPMLYNVILSLQDVTQKNLINGERQFVALANYADLFADSVFRRSIGNTLFRGRKAVLLAFLVTQMLPVLVLLGGSAANALLENEEPISRMRGKWLEYKTEDGNSVAVMATFHPAYLLRNAGQKAKIWADFLRLKKKIS